MHVLDPLEVTMQSKPQQVCILALGDVLCYTGADLWLWLLLHREIKQADGNSYLTTGIAKLRYILDPLSSKEEGKQKEKKKRYCPFWMGSF